MTMFVLAVSHFWKDLFFQWKAFLKVTQNLKQRLETESILSSNKKLIIYNTEFFSPQIII